MLPFSLFVLIAPTRALVLKLRELDCITSATGMRRWNLGFQTLALIFCVASITHHELGWTIWSGLYWIFGYLALARINELVFAFYRDALSRIERETPRLPLRRSERIGFLAVGYVEIIVQFGIVHLVLQELTYENAYSKPFAHALDSIYFSGVTITTTGFGDYAPQSLVTRYATLYEAVIGIVFLALALAAYLSADEKGKE
jgi:hypothetical protein